MSAFATSYLANAGGICGISRDEVQNCYNIGDILAASLSIATVTGISSGSGITSNCYNAGNLSVPYSSSPRVGGIGGGNSLNCYNAGKISVTANSSSYIGGISSGLDSIISKCYNSGGIVASNSINSINTT